MTGRAALLLFGAAIAAAAPAAEPAPAADAIEQPLAAAGDAERGRAIVTSRQTGLCLLCHPAPLPEPNLHGDIGPSLAGVGSRLTAGQLRLRVADARQLNPASVMPVYFGDWAAAGERTGAVNHAAAAGRTNVAATVAASERASQSTNTNMSAGTGSSAAAGADVTMRARTVAGARVAPAFAGQPVLDAQQVEDVVAFLRTLK